MNSPVSLLWFEEGKDPQCLPPPLTFSASQGCDFQGELVSLSDASLAYMANSQDEEEETYRILKRLRELGYLE